MNKTDTFFKRIDKKIDVIVRPYGQALRRILPYLASLVIAVLVGTMIWRLTHQKPDLTVVIVRRDVNQIADILGKIDKDCTILSFDYERNYVDFLTVKEFVGSEIGALNLAYPDKWQGPYIEDNPTLQGKVYEIVQVKEGVFLIPGTGVRLPSGFTLGKDVIITPKTSINTMLKSGGVLNHRGESLGIKLPFKSSQKDEPLLKPTTIEKVSDTLEEFNEAMPYAHNNRLRRDDKQGELSYHIMSVPEKG